MISVGRSMFTWGIGEGKVKRSDNPFSNTETSLPKKKKGQRGLNLQEAQDAWDGLSCSRWASLAGAFAMFASPRSRGRWTKLTRHAHALRPSGLARMR